MATINSWYRGINVPSFHKREQMIDFVQSSLSLLNAIIGNTVGARITTVFTNQVETAASDLTNNIIYFPLSYLESDGPVAQSKHNSDVALSVIIGSTIHEALHFAHTKIPIVEALAILEMQNNVAINALLQITEDVYIDTHGASVIPAFEWATKHRYDVLFNRSEFNSRFAEVKRRHPETIEEVASIINALVMLKNPSNRHSTGYESFDRAAAMVLSCTRLSNQVDRIHKAREIYDFLMSGVPQQNDAEHQGQQDSGLIDMVDADADADVDTGRINASKDDISTSNMVDAGESQISNGNGSKTSVIDIVPSIAAFTGLGLVNDSEVMNDVKFATVDKRYIDLATLIHARTIVNHPVGQANNRGSKIRRIDRIVTDGKIFADPVKVNSIGKQEVIVLVDWSGSMIWSGNLRPAVEAATGAAIGLEHGRHRVAVYSHTADIYGSLCGSIPVAVYRLKGFDESSNVMKDRIQACTQFDTYGNNDDESAIEYVSKKFSSLPNTKTLIVISDGQPACRRFSDGIRETHKAVDELRKGGINVISISITKEASNANDKIYGYKNNVYNSDPNVISQILENMMK